MLRAFFALGRIGSLTDRRPCRPRIQGAAVAQLVLLAGLTVMSITAQPVWAGEFSTAEDRGKAFWLALARDCSIPTGESAAQLMNEAVSLLGSRDSQWRDDVGYGVVAACVYQARRLSPAERRTLIDALTANLRRGIGEVGTDSVLAVRSFAALDLSILAALELVDPVLDDSGYQQLLDNALVYLHEERDLRGLEPGVGWIHARPHTRADLLEVSGARSPVHRGGPAPAVGCCVGENDDAWDSRLGARGGRAIGRRPAVGCATNGLRPGQP